MCLNSGEDLSINKQLVIEIIDFKVYGFNYTTNNSLIKLYQRIAGKRQLNERLLKSVLKKCPNIRRVIIMEEVDSAVMSLIGRYCPHIKSLSLDCQHVVKCVDFFLKYGHKLEELIIHEEIKQFREFINFCPNLKKIKAYTPSSLLYDNYLPKLEYFENIISEYDLHICSIDVIELKIFSNRYNQTIKTLNLLFCYLTTEELKTCLQYISRFENLRQLKLIIDLQHMSEPIDDSLTVIGQKCIKLFEFGLNFRYFYSLPISDRFFNIFTEFKAIKKLKIRFKDNKVLSGSVECFRHCKQLYELDINYYELTEHFFTNVQSFVPQLKYLKIITQKQFSDLFIDSFHSMKIIQRVELHSDFPEEEDKHKIWYFGKCLTELILTPKLMNVIPVNDNCSLIINNSNYYNPYYFYFN